MVNDLKEAMKRTDAAMAKEAAAGKLDSRYPDGNPKTQYGLKKPPLWYVPFVALYKTALAHLHGALKYGHFNWRDDPVAMSAYLDAAMRHITAFKEGEQNASDSGLHHLSHAAACLNIIMDAEHNGSLIDDRHVHKTDFDTLFDDLRPSIERLYADWGPGSESAEKEKFARDFKAAKPAPKLPLASGGVVSSKPRIVGNNPTEVVIDEKALADALAKDLDDKPAGKVVKK